MLEIRFRINNQKNENEKKEKRIFFPTFSSFREIEMLCRATLAKAKLIGFIC